VPAILGGILVFVVWAEYRQTKQESAKHLCTGISNNKTTSKADTNMNIEKQIELTPSVRLYLPGGPGSGANPRRLFAAGWSAFFPSALKQVASKMNLKLALLVFSICGPSALTLGADQSQVAAAVSSAKNVVLVHGAFADGSSWAKVIPLLEAKGLHVTAVQNPLYSLADDVAATRRAIARQDGPVVLVGHSWAGMVISEAGNDPKVAGLVYIAALVPDGGQSAGDVLKPYAPSPGIAEAKPDAAGFLSLTRKGIDEDFVPDLRPAERAIVYATQGPWNSACFADKVSVPAWTTKPSWFIAAANDRMLPPDYEQAVAEHIHATTTTLPTGHVPMLSRPKQVAAVIVEAANTPFAALAPARASAQSVAPLSGVMGQVKSVTSNSIEIGTKSGIVSLGITQPLTTYRQVPSDLGQVTSDSYIGVASEEGPDGTEVAKRILIFPPELRGAAEGSVLLDAPADPVRRSRMTNGSVSGQAAPQLRTRMTNGVLEKGSGTTLVVNYQDGSRTISVPAGVPVTKVEAGSVALEAGGIAYAVTVKQPTGELETSSIFVISAPATQNTN
jgi:pimeloyl-ACP methyl ester carboxylesterase